MSRQVSANVKLFVQQDCTVLVDSLHPDYADVGLQLGRFADLVKSPDNGLHRYRITPLSLWHAASEGLTAEEVIGFLDHHDAYGVSTSIKDHIRRLMNRYGTLRLVSSEDGQRLVLAAAEWKIMRDINEIRAVNAYFQERKDALEVVIDPRHRGVIKQELLRAGYPVIDQAHYQSGESLPLKLQESEQFQLRDYQREAIEGFLAHNGSDQGSGVIVLPCGAGKTVVGIGMMDRLQCATLILTSNTTSVKQWRRELLNRTNANEAWIGEYSGASKEVKPITIATYHMLTYRQSKSGEPVHMALFHKRKWGLIIYDEVHLLPAPVFRITADLQATRRLGLSATLVREDGREEDVFSLIGPKRYELRWKALEQSGWIASAVCCEIAVPMRTDDRQRYLTAPRKHKHRIAGENAVKLEVVRKLLTQHAGSKIIIIGHYIHQLKRISKACGAPLISGDTPQEEREGWYHRFKHEDTDILILSKVANFAVDLPAAGIAIQISGSFGSRQEEAQRLGRVLRPKQGENQALFYTLVTADSCEAEFARNRQLFLLEQGYTYHQLTYREEAEEICYEAEG